METGFNAFFISSNLILKATSGDLTNLNGERCLLLFNSPGSSSNSAVRGFLILE